MKSYIAYQLADEITQLGYDDRYCGFQHTTTQEEIDGIKDKLSQTNQLK